MTKNNFETLTYPPSIEAVLDITVNEVESFNVDKLAVKNKNSFFRKKFPKMEELRQFHSTVAVGQNQRGNVSYQSRQLGYLYKSPEEKSLCQFRANGFSYNHLKPYPGWEQFVQDGISNWNEYKKLRKATDIARIGLRFINVIEIADLSSDLSEHFNVTLSIPTGIGKLKHLNYRYIIDFSDDCIGIVNFAKLDDSTIGSGNFVLDIDIVKQNLTGLIEDHQILQYLKEMREDKNSIFFGTLTSQTLESYK